MIPEFPKNSTLGRRLVGRNLMLLLVLKLLLVFYIVLGDFICHGERSEDYRGEKPTAFQTEF